MTASLDRITIYPVKSLDGVAVEQATLLPSGALEHDRRYAFFDAAGQILNGKRSKRMQQLRSDFDFPSQTIMLWTADAAQKQTYCLSDLAARRALSDWCSQFVDLAVELRENVDNGFPDDLDSPGPTIVSTATLAAVAAWFPELDLDEIRRRFRANLEIGEVEAFWEDRLYGPDGQTVPFSIGGCKFLGVNPCQRCPVPTRSSLTGDAWPGFAKQFAERREESLPPWADRGRFDHFYRLAVNTRLAGGERLVRAGDAVNCS